MIKKTLAVAAILLVLYTLFVLFFAPKWWYASQHQWQDNLIKAQHYLYDESDTIRNVIVGSSLSCRIVADSLPQTYNLSFNGQSIYDGLDIITHKSKLPENVFVEMNIALREGSEDFTSSLYTPVLAYLKKIFPSLRADKQPLGVVGRVSAYVFRSIRENKQQKENMSTETVTRINDDLFVKMLDFQIREYSFIPDTAVVNRCFKNLSAYITEIESRGGKIIFFEIPVNNKLTNLPREVVVREKFYQLFPPTKYDYIHIPDSVDYVTTDGQHLNSIEALDYTLYFRSQSNALLN